MKQLTDHLRHIRRQHIDDRLIVVFGIAGTTLDMRYMVHNILKAFDEEYHTRLFYRLSVDGIIFDENQVI